jgi:vacuolar-type H+-ATPase catalytic subunit A/Vma1
LNNRVLTEGQVPWSIRQSAVYHKFTPNEARKSTFVIIAPSTSGEQMIEHSIDLAVEDAEAVSPFNLHRLLIADSMKNWQDYMATLEEMLTEQVGLCYRY